MTRTKGSTNKNKVWSPAHVKKYTALFNKYTEDTNKNLNIDTFIDVEKRNLLTYIDNLDLGNSRKKDYYYVVGRYLDIKNDRYADIYKQRGYDMYKLIEDFEKEGNQTEKEIEHYMKIPTINYIRKNIEDPYKNLDIHYQHLLLSLLVLQPPLRPDFYETCKIINQAKQDDKKGNFLFINNKTKKMYYIINDDKISKSRFHLDKIEIESPELKDIIIKSVNYYPRSYLFEDIDNNPISYYRILHLLRRVLNNSNIGFSMVRSAYVNDYYLTHVDFKDQEKLAEKMRHSKVTAQKHYSKPKLLHNNENCDDIKAELEIIKITQPKPIIEDQKYKIARSNILIKINQRHSIPRNPTIDKYNLIYDENAKVWK